MKTAYELAMERLNQGSPSVKLTDEQKRAIAELESRYRARMADREITIQSQLKAAAAQGDPALLEQLEQQLASERRKIAEELEEQKAKIRRGV